MPDPTLIFLETAFSVLTLSPWMFHGGSRHAYPAGQGTVGGHGAEKSRGGHGVADEVGEYGGEKDGEDDVFAVGGEGPADGGEGGGFGVAARLFDGGDPVAGAGPRGEGRDDREKDVGGDGGGQGGHHDQEGALDGEMAAAGYDGDGFASFEP